MCQAAWLRTTPAQGGLFAMKKPHDTPQRRRSYWPLSWLPHRVVTMRAALAEDEAMLAEQPADAPFQALFQSFLALIAPGGWRRTESRVR